MDKLCRGPYKISSILKWVTKKKLTKRLIKKKNNDCFWMENIFCLESHIHLCSCHTSAIPAYVIKTCLTWHAISGARYWGFVSPKLHVSTYRNKQHCWCFHNTVYVYTFRFSLWLTYFTFEVGYIVANLLSIINGIWQISVYSSVSIPCDRTEHRNSILYPRYVHIIDQIEWNITMIY